MRRYLLLGFILGLIMTVMGTGASISAGENSMTTTKITKTQTATGMDASHLSEQQKYVTLHDGTEPPFRNEYWDHKEPGIYVDRISGKPLFSSTDKFDSGTGWPSFTKPINPALVAQFQDDSHGMSRIEVRSKDADAHLGHLFDDGPVERGGQRYCMNSASLRFVHKNNMAQEGYAQYLYLFDPVDAPE